MRKVYTGLITKLEPNQIFVFGSNMFGFHGGGAAGFATFNNSDNWRSHDYHLKPNGYKGAWTEKGIAEGIQCGNCGKSYAIPTVYKAGQKRSRTIKQILESIYKFYGYAHFNSSTEFFVAYTNNGRNLNGYSNQEMANMFYDANDGIIPENVIFEKEFNHLVFNNREEFDIENL